MFKRFAFYEKAATGWGLVVYHDHLPGKPVGGQAPERVGPFEVPQEMIDVDGTPNMGAISKAFPAPKPMGYDEPVLVLNQEEEWPLPEWASAKAPEGMWTVMQQLITKDPNARDNATLAAIKGDGEQFLVVTDANNWITYTLDELEWAYSPGKFILKDFPNPKSRDYLNDTRTF